MHKFCADVYIKAIVTAQIWAYATFGYTPDPLRLIDELAMAAMKVMSTFSCQNISNTMWCPPSSTTFPDPSPPPPPCTCNLFEFEYRMH